MTLIKVLSSSCKNCVINVGKKWTSQMSIPQYLVQVLKLTSNNTVSLNMVFSIPQNQCYSGNTCTTGVKSLLSWDIYCDLNGEGRRRNCIFLLWIEQELISFKYEWRKWKRIKNYMSQYHLKGYENVLVGIYVSRNFNSHIHFVHLAT